MTTKPPLPTPSPASPTAPLPADASSPQLVADCSAVAGAIRKRVLAHLVAHGEGYLSQACSAAELLATLYVGVMRLGPSLGPPIPPPFSRVPGAGIEPIRGALYNGAETPDFDRFFFSPVHYALVLYAALVETGRMAPEGLEGFNRDGTTIEMIGAEHSPGIATTAGSLAQALSVAAGVALARKLRGDPGRVWVFMSDGEVQEGQTWEALAAARFHRLSNLGVVMDVNGQQCDGPMSTVMEVEPIAERMRAFGAVVAEVDAHDVPALLQACQTPHPEGPLVVLGRSDPCHGLPLLRERAPNLHYVRFKGAAERDRYRAALNAMGGA